MFENHRKSLIQYCERSELRLHFEWTKVNWKCQKWSILERFWKLEACSQTVLPDRSVLIGQKLAENAKIEKFKCDILSNFQTMWTVSFWRKSSMSVKRKRTWWKVGIIKVIEGQDSRPILFADFATSLVVLFFASWHLLVGLLVREPFCWKKTVKQLYPRLLPMPIWPNLAFDNSTLQILTHF